MNPDKPDRFGSSANFMIGVHNKIQDQLCKRYRMNKIETELAIYQMSIFEYITEKHDEDYSYFNYKINNSIKEKYLMPAVFIAVNNKYLNSTFNEQYFKIELPKIIVKEWNNIKFRNLEFYARSNEIECENNDTIQSIHFFYKNEQLFKIIYSYDAFKDILNS